MPNPLNIADGYSICLENPFGDSVFAHFVLDPDILAVTPSLLCLNIYQWASPTPILKGDMYLFSPNFDVYIPADKIYLTGWEFSGFQLSSWPYC